MENFQKEQGSQCVLTDAFIDYNLMKVQTEQHQAHCLQTGRVSLKKLNILLLWTGLLTQRPPQRL